MIGSAVESKSSTPEGATAHRWNDLVEIVGTDKAKYLTPGKKYVIHRLQLDNLVKKGEAKKA